MRKKGRQRIFFCVRKKGDTFHLPHLHSCSCRSWLVTLQHFFLPHLFLSFELTFHSFLYFLLFFLEQVSWLTLPEKCRHGENDERWKSIECHFHQLNRVSFFFILSLIILSSLIFSFSSWYTFWEHETRSSERNGRKNLPRTITWDASGTILYHFLSPVLLLPRFLLLSSMSLFLGWRVEWEM